MLNWYDKLYIGNGLGYFRLKKMKSDLDAGRPVGGCYLVTLASNPVDQLEIISSAYLLQKTLYARTPMVVGIAGSYDDAVQLVVQITEEAVQKLGRADLRAYLQES